MLLYIIEERFAQATEGGASHGGGGGHDSRSTLTASDAET